MADERGQREDKQPARGVDAIIGDLDRIDSKLPRSLAHVWLLVIPSVAVLGSIYVFVYGSGAPGAAYVIGSGLMFGAAAFLAGGLIGFLFGVPRGAGGDSGVGTALEQISTWLATIVVGLTLTQISRIPAVLGKLADDMGPALGKPPSSGEFGLALVIFYAVLGFLFLYLWTRTVFTRQLDARTGGGSPTGPKQPNGTGGTTGGGTTGGGTTGSGTTGSGTTGSGQETKEGE